MTNRGKIPQAMKKIALATAMAVFGSQAGAALITADGKLDSTDGSTYALGYTIGFIDDKGQAIGDGKLWFGINSADSTQFLYFQMPLSYVDNTYGANAAADWGKKGHSFDDLLKSDSLGNQDTKKGTLGFGWNGNSADIDYLGAVEVGSGKSAVVTGYRSGGGGAGVDADGVTKYNDGKLNAGSGASILEIATSLEYNLGLFPGLIVDSGTDPAWIKEVGYEIQFAAGTFDAADWLDPAKAYTLITLGNPHVSPSKKTFGGYDDPVCEVGCGGGPPSQIPEPGSLLLLGAGFAALGLAGRRRRPPTGSAVSPLA